MANHNHQLNFVMNLKSGKFNTTIKDAVTQVRSMQKAIQALQKTTGIKPGKAPSKSDVDSGKGGILSQIFMPKLLRALPGDVSKLTKAIGPMSGALGALAVYAAYLTKQWYNWYTLITDTRKTIGLSMPEARDFGMEVLSMTSRFGIAMDRVANTARFVGQGTNIAETGVVRLGAALVNIADASKSAEGTTQQFGFMLNRTMKMSEDQTAATAAGVLAISRNAHVAMEDLQKDLMSGRQAIFLAQKTIGGPEAISRFGALAAGMRNVGAEGHEVRAVMGELGNRSSKLFKIFAASKYDMGEFQKTLSGILKGIKSGTLESAALGEVWDRLGPITLEKLAEGAQDTKDDMAEFNRVVGLSAKAREEWVLSTLSPLDRLGRSFGRFFGMQKEGFTKLVEGPMDRFLNKLADMSEYGVEVFDILTDKIGKDLYIAWEQLLKGPVSTFIGDLKWLYEKIFENPLTAKKITAPKTPPETATWMEGKPWLATPPAEPTGATGRWRGAKPMAFPPNSAAPSVKKDPAVELLGRQLQTLQRIADGQDEAAKKADLERTRYNGPTTGSAASEMNPMVQAQRS